MEFRKISSPRAGLRGILNGKTNDARPIIGKIGEAIANAWAEATVVDIMPDNVPPEVNFGTVIGREQLRNLQTPTPIHRPSMMFMLDKINNQR